MKRRATSTSVAAALLILGLLIGAAGSYAYITTTTPTGQTSTVTNTTTFSTTITQTGAAAAPVAAVAPYTIYLGNLSSSALCATAGTYQIGALTDLSDGLSSEGVRVKAAINLAIVDINNYLASIGCKATFAATIDDYKLDATTANNELSAMNTAGIKVVVGPLNSGTAIVILPTANADHIVLISPSSTSIALHIPNDYLVRTAPSDTWQAQADARELWDRGVKSVIVAHVHDSYGDNLANTTAKDFAALGGTVYNQGNFFQWSETQTDFSSIVPGMDTSYKAAVAAQGGDASKVAIYMVAFEECVNLFTYTHANYPDLLQSTWYGSDGTATDSVIINATTSGNYVAQVKLPSTEYAPLNSTLFQAFANSFQKTSGFIADGYATGSYDDTWLAALSILAAGSNDGAAIQKVISTVAANTYGVTGWLSLDSAGDRVPTNGYDVWKVVLVGGVPTWVVAGHWSLPDSIHWSSPP